MFLDRLQVPCAWAAVSFAAAGSFTSTLSCAQTAPASAASSPAPELTPNERAQRDADKVFKWILIHSDKPRKAGANRAEERREDRPVVAARAKPVLRGSEAAAPASVSAAAVEPAPTPVVDTPMVATPSPATEPVAETPPAPVTTASVPLAAIEARSVPISAAPPAAVAPEALDETLTPLSRTDPKLPASVLRTLRKGNVQVRFTVLPDGSVAEPGVVTSSNPKLNSSALAAIAQWRFAPLRKPQSAIVDLAFDFD